MWAPIVNYQTDFEGLTPKNKKITAKKLAWPMMWKTTFGYFFKEDDVKKKFLI